MLASLILCSHARAFAVEADRWQEAFTSDGIVVLKNNRALPRFWLVHEVKAVTAKAGLIQLRGEAGRLFDPTRTALIETSAKSLPAVAGGGNVGTLRVIAQESGRFSFEVDTPDPAFLVVSESYFPGWEASVDGHGTRVYPTNFAIMGVAIPGGRHTVDLWFRPYGAITGGIVSLLALVTLVGLALWSRMPFLRRWAPFTRTSEETSDR